MSPIFNQIVQLLSRLQPGGSKKKFTKTPSSAFPGLFMDLYKSKTPNLHRSSVSVDDRLKLRVSPPQNISPEAQASFLKKMDRKIKRIDATSSKLKLQFQKYTDEAALMEKRRRMNNAPSLKLPDSSGMSFRDIVTLTQINHDDLKESFAAFDCVIDKPEALINMETIQLVLLDMGYDVSVNKENAFEAYRRPIPEDISEWPSRPPVVCVMGHVNHGKTTLIDRLRSSKIAASEFGGITQSIGAFTVQTDDGAICVMDTPGHSAFRHMRALGAHLTDVVVLVVAADDSVMPQTIEAIRLTQQAGVPLVVAVNKCDMFEHNFRNVKADLAKNGIFDESEGGDCYIVAVSAKTGLNINELLEKISFMAEMMNLKADPTGPAEAMIVEARVDRGRGPISNIIVDRGTLKVGDCIVSGAFYGRVKDLINDVGVSVESAGPSTPIAVVGLNGVPEAGSDFIVVDNIELAEKISVYRTEREKDIKNFKYLIEQKKKSKAPLENQENEDSEESKTTEKTPLHKKNLGHKLELRREKRIAKKEAKMEEIQAAKDEKDEIKLPVINIMLKADNNGSLNTVKDFISSIPSDEVKVDVIETSIGEITSSDLQKAKIFNAAIFGFNVFATEKIMEVAKANKTTVKSHKLIYSLFDDIRAFASIPLSPRLVPQVFAAAEILQVFSLSSSNKNNRAKGAAGCRVTKGNINLSLSRKFRVMRSGKEIFQGDIHSLRHLKNPVKEVKKGIECGIVLEGFSDFEKGDIVEHVVIKEEKRLLDIPIYSVSYGSDYTNTYKFGGSKQKSKSGSFKL